jgi:hypothetical protein
VADEAVVEQVVLDAHLHEAAAREEILSLASPYCGNGRRPISCTLMSARKWFLDEPVAVAVA